MRQFAYWSYSELMRSIAVPLAFKTGDPKRVNEMYAMLKHSMARNLFNIVNPLDVKKQMELEFETTVS